MGARKEREGRKDERKEEVEEEDPAEKQILEYFQEKEKCRRNQI